MLACRVLGHRPRFSAEGRTLTWRCERGCGAGGTKTYETERDAHRYAAALDRPDSDDVGRRPLLSLLPLRLARRSRSYRSRS
ncbi:MAG TPA: hypothetical protein VFH44_04650 [Solirubrobacterales bacterium]|nr:hypothetical protein [Solirubrobacterales bacterium]